MAEAGVLSPDDRAELIEGGYRRAHPSPDDVLLLIEVGDTTLRFDLGEKAQLYATHGILEYWVVDLVANRVWCHRHPRGTQYAEPLEIVDGALELPNALDAIAPAELF